MYQNQNAFEYHEDASPMSDLSFNILGLYIVDNDRSSRPSCQSVPQNTSRRICLVPPTDPFADSELEMKSLKESRNLYPTYTNDGYNSSSQSSPCPSRPIGDDHFEVSPLSEDDKILKEISSWADSIQDSMNSSNTSVFADDVQMSPIPTSAQMQPVKENVLRLDLSSIPSPFTLEFEQFAVSSSRRNYSSRIIGHLEYWPIHPKLKGISLR